MFLTKICNSAVKRYRKISKFLSVAAITGAMSLANVTSAFAVGETEANNVKEGINTFRTILAGFGEPICIIVMVIAGIALMGGQQGRQWSKPTMLFAAIGFAIIKFAPTIVDLLSVSFDA